MSRDQYDIGIQSTHSSMRQALMTKNQNSEHLEQGGGVVRLERFAAMEIDDDASQPHPPRR